MFRVEKNLISQRGQGGVGTSIMHSRIATKFHLKMTLLNFWIKLTQKGYFRTKKMEITIEFYIFKLIQILNFSFNKQFGFLKQISKKIYTSGQKHKKMNMRLQFFEPNFPKRLPIFSLKQIKQTPPLNFAYSNQSLYQISL